MNARAVWHLALADFRERTRRYSFLITLLLVIYLGYLVNTGELAVRLTTYRGVFNSAWIGAEMALVISTFLALVGFYLVKNTVERDIHTGVGQIIATTPTSRAAYLLGKWLSNFLVLGVMVAILAAAAGVMVLLRGEAAFEPIPLIAPLLVIALPAIAFTSGLAVFFEAVPWLRGGIGNILYFFLFIFIMAMPLSDPGKSSLLPDIIGLRLVYPSMLAALRATGVDYNSGIQISISPGLRLEPFLWKGIEWNAANILPQLAWVGVSLALVMVSALFFERFDPSQGIPRVKLPGKARAEQGLQEKPRKPTLRLPLPAVRLPAPRSHFQMVFYAELAMLLKGLRWWWYWVAAGLALGALFSPADVVRAGLLPAAWIWPILVWSGMGVREKRCNTYQMVYSAPHPLARQLAPAWLAGAAVTALLGSGALLSFLFQGDGLGIAAYLGGVIFIPSLALAFGTWSGSSKPFEVVYLLLWYSGPINRFDMLNFAASTTPAVIIGYALGGVALLGLAVLGKQKQLRS